MSDSGMSMEERNFNQPAPDRVLNRPPFSTAVRSGSNVYISGQGGIDLEAKAVAGPDLKTQVEFTMRNLERALAKAELTLSDVVQATVYLSDRSLYAPFNELYRDYFRQPYPARTVVYCELNYGLLVEIDVIATTDADKQYY
ncbi:RidA family protein [Paenibacillus mesophilus]|uniref:RidA family protein n=1 Tax=Paenibacillus mesophilus TaxID=2582849 RepID=UPI001EE45EEE|nr:RidA family protein [Paenibacillus mesophilus]